MKGLGDLNTMGKVDLPPNLRGKELRYSSSAKHQQAIHKHLKHLSEEAPRRRGLR